LARTEKLFMHAAREGIAVVGLDDEMEVIVLHRELHDAKVLATRPAHRALEGRVQRLGAKAREPPPRAHRDVQRIPVLVHRSRPVPHVCECRGHHHQQISAYNSLHDALEAVANARPASRHTVRSIRPHLVSPDPT
jgi:hypothetical protein